MGEAIQGWLRSKNLSLEGSIRTELITRKIYAQFFSANNGKSYFVFPDTEARDEALEAHVREGISCYDDDLLSFHTGLSMEDVQAIKTLRLDNADSIFNHMLKHKEDMNLFLRDVTTREELAVLWDCDEEDRHVYYGDSYHFDMHIFRQACTQPFY